MRYRTFMGICAAVALCIVMGTRAETPKMAGASDLDGDWAKMKPLMPRQYVCQRARGPITIDGQDDEPSWASAPWTDDFADIQGPSRPAPRFRTRAKMLWDDQNLYVFAELHEPHVWGTLTKKNSIIFNDNDFEVFINPASDNRNYYEFEMNALNTIWELTLDKPYRDQGKPKLGDNIDGVRTAVHVNGTLNNPSDTDQSWCVEIAFPFKGLAAHADGMACPPHDGDQWRMGFSRVEWLIDIIDGKYHKIPKEMRPEDNWVWSPTGVIDMHRPERWGYVQFTTGDAATMKFRPDPTFAARDLLMTVYYRQRNYKQIHGAWAKTLGELGLQDATASHISGPLDLHMTPEGYEVDASLKLPDGKTPTLHLTEDSHLWLTQ